MSRADDRVAIGAALSTVTGVTGFPSRPNVMNVGDAWPQWRGSTMAGNGWVRENTWNVLVVLPDQDVDADAFADAVDADLAEALRPLIFIDAIQPATITTSEGDMYALLIIGRSE